MKKHLFLVLISTEFCSFLQINNRIIQKCRKLSIPYFNIHILFIILYLKIELFWVPCIYIFLNNLISLFLLMLFWLGNSIFVSYESLILLDPVLIILYWGLVFYAQLGNRLLALLLLLLCCVSSNLKFSLYLCEKVRKGLLEEGIYRNPIALKGASEL